MNDSNSATESQQRLFAEPAPTITAIRPIEHDPNLREIVVDGRPRCIIRAADVDELRISVDLTWTDSLASAASHRARVVDARHSALSRLGRRAHSAAQLRSKLADEFDAAIASTVIDELTADGWLDDASFARDCVDSILSRGPAGPAMLRAKLQQAGIDPDLAAQVVESVTDENQLGERAVRFVSSRVGRSSQDRHVLARRLASQLTRRGLDQEIIVNALRDAGLEPPVNDADAPT